MCKIHAFSRIILKLVVVEGFVVTVELFLALFSSPQGFVHCFPFVAS